MGERVTALLVCVTLLAQSFGCTVHRDEKVPVSGIAEIADNAPREEIQAAVFHDGTVVEFAGASGRLSPDGTTIHGYMEDGTYKTVQVSELEYITVRRTSGGRSALATIGAVFLLGVVVMIGVMVASSCPFVYSNNGDQFVLDAEPLGGTVSRAFERLDLARLEHLRDVDGKYTLLVRNELDEIQYLDHMKLLVVDHDPDGIVRTDLNGTINLLRKPVPPARAEDENARDLLNFVRERDDVYWHSPMSSDDAWKDEPLRHELTFYYPRPDTARTARLVVNAGTALWGASMVRDMLQLRGQGIARWHASLAAHGKAMEDLVAFNTREELYFLRYYVREGEDWRFQGWIPGGGPVVVEDLVLPVDLANVQGDTVAIRVMPPRGFWTIDYMGLDFGESETVAGQVVPLLRATDKARGDVTSLLAESDGNRYVMTAIGDEATLEYLAPPLPPGLARTVFLDTRGYYEINIDESQPENTALIERLLTEPGAIVEYSMERFVEFVGSTQARK